MVRFIILIGILGLNTACSVSRETFECPPGSGVSCKSISEVHRLQSRTRSAEGKIPVLAPEIADRLPISQDLALSRISEQHLKIWIAPFSDEQHNFFESSVIHTVLVPGYWQWENALKSGS